MVIDKRCHACGEPLRQRDNEQLRDWRERKTCGRTCHVARKNAVPVWDRFIIYTRLTPSGCIEWTGAIDAEGYGRLETRGEVLAHRISYLMQYGSIPDGMLVCHRCDNRRCVNHGHLFLGTHQDNTDDRVRKGRGTTAAGPDNPNWRHGRFAKKLEAAQCHTAT